MRLAIALALSSMLTAAAAAEPGVEMAAESPPSVLDFGGLRVSVESVAWIAARDSRSAAGEASSRCVVAVRAIAADSRVPLRLMSASVVDVRGRRFHVNAATAPETLAVGVATSFEFAVPEGAALVAIELNGRQLAIAHAGPLGDWGLFAE